MALDVKRNLFSASKLLCLEGVDEVDGVTTIILLIEFVIDVHEGDSSMKFGMSH